MTVSEVLFKAADLCKQGWMQDWYAKDAKGYNTQPTSHGVVCVCAWGAIQRAAMKCVAGIDDEATVFAETVIRRRAHRRIGIARWNDAKGRTKSQVVRMLKEAARLAQAEGR